MASFAELYPLSTALGLRPVYVSTGYVFTGGQRQEAKHEYDGFDPDDVLKAFGGNTARFNRLMSSVKSLFCCAHRNWPDDHDELHKRGAEVHCLWADDVEAFLKAGN